MGTAVELYRRPEAVAVSDEQGTPSRTMSRERRLGFSDNDIRFYGRMLTTFTAREVNRANQTPFHGAFVEELDPAECPAADCAEAQVVDHVESLATAQPVFGDVAEAIRARQTHDSQASGLDRLHAMMRSFHDQGLAS